MGDEKFLYYVVYEIWGHWNAFSTILRLGQGIDSELGFTEAELQLKKKHPGEKITITNWKRID